MNKTSAKSIKSETEYYPDGWKLNIIGDFLSLEYGKGLKEDLRKPGKVPVYGSNGVVGYHNEQMVDGPGIIVGRKGSAGEVIFSKKGFFPIDTTYFVKTNLDKSYIYYLLKNLDLKKFVGSSAVPGLNRNDVYSQIVAIPKAENEQQKIAEILSSLDDKIELNRQMNATLEKIASTLFKKWFVDIGDELPKGWKKGAISDFGSVICGKTPPKSVKEYFGGNFPFIKIPDMHGSPFIFITEDSLSEMGMNFQKNKVIPAGSICVSCIATVGLVSMTTVNSQTNQQINSIVPSEKYYQFYLYETFKNISGLLQRMGSSGSATLNVNTTSFSAIEILRPTDAALEKFDRIVRPFFDQIKHNLQENINLSILRDSLLPRLMSGRIRV
ncbi:MAG: restriction endonuclease subunit S [Patescibacteria group bacterium]|jgi:type I restriction enzyme S subunit